MNIAARETLNIPMKQKKMAHAPDLSYLREDPQTSLAGRLFKPTVQIRREKKRAKRKDAKLSTPGSTTKTKKIEPPDFAAITEYWKDLQKVRESARLEREREREIEMGIEAYPERQKEREMAVKGTPYSLSTKKSKSNIFLKLQMSPLSLERGKKRVWRGRGRWKKR